MADVPAGAPAALSSGESQAPSTTTSPGNSPEPINLTSPRGRAIRFLRRAARCLALVVAFYGAACLVGLSPVNTQFENSAGGIEVFVYTDHLQSKVLVPYRSAVGAWEGSFPREDFTAVDREQKYIAFSWEDRAFALETPTWQDAHCLTALRAALLPTKSVMRVEYCERPQDRSSCRRLLLSTKQYLILSQQIANSLDRGINHKPKRIEGAPAGPSAGFYEAHGRFYFLATGNNWTGACLKRAGVRTGMWTPFSVGVAQVTE
jgi:uncharacterized protein (TIGR02117 family)